MSSFRISVVISCYRHFEALKLVLLGYQQQTFSDFEIILAEDGESDEIAEIAEGGRAAGLTIQHVSQKDLGFRKTIALNKAVSLAKSDLVLFTDGDCIPRNDFLKQYAENYSPGLFLSSGYTKLSAAASQNISAEVIISGEIFKKGWLKKNDQDTRWFKKHMIGNQFGAIADKLTPTSPTFNGHGSMLSIDDFVEVNGFDNTLAYGGEDRELGERLMRKGLKGYQLRNRAIVFHVDHARGYVDPREVDRIAQIRRMRQQLGTTSIHDGYIQALNYD